MLLAIRRFINVQSLFIGFFRKRVLFKATIGIANVLFVGGLVFLVTGSLILSKTKLDCLFPLGRNFAT